MLTVWQCISDFNQSAIFLINAICSAKYETGNVTLPHTGPVPCDVIFADWVNVRFVYRVFLGLVPSCDTKSDLNGVRTNVQVRRSSSFFRMKEFTLSGKEIRKGTEQNIRIPILIWGQKSNNSRTQNRQN